MSRFAVALFVATVLAACGGSNESTAPPPPIPVRGIKVVVGGFTDTVVAVHAPGLRVEVHDSTGALAPAGTLVSIAAIVNSRPKPVQLAAPGTNAFQDSLVVSTNAAGIAAADIRLGTRTETVQVAVAVPTLRVADTLAYVIQPGARFYADIGVRDTAVVVGKSITLPIVITDFWGNVLREPLAPWTVVAKDTLVTTTPDGVVTGRAFGTSTVIIAGNPAASPSDVGAPVDVVPAGRFVVLASGSLVLVDADGANRKTLARGVTELDALEIGARPQWMPDHASVVFANMVNGHKTLQVVDTNGVVRPFFASQPAAFTDAAQPAVSADGQWIYFEALDPSCSPVLYCLYRAKIDGTQPELLGTPAAAGTWLHPSPSPDGARVAIATGSFGNGGVHVFDIASRTLSSWSAPGTSPCWSPDGSEIAYVGAIASAGGEVPSIIRPDGSGQASFEVATFAMNYLEWSRDGTYFVGFNEDTPILVRPTGEFAVWLSHLPIGAFELALP